MRKSSYLLVGLLVGALFATAGSALAAEVKTLIGKKVTGEVTVVVNGKTLTDKGAVIDGRTNVPVRAISDALNAEISVKGGVVSLTTETTELGGETPKATTKSDNPYVGRSKESLLKAKDGFENDILARIKESISAAEKSIADYERFKLAGGPAVEVADTGIANSRATLEKLKADEAKYLATLAQILEALALAE